jgi:hypothetical protein
MITTVEHPEGTKLVPFEGGWKVETILEKNKWYKNKEYGNLVFYHSNKEDNYGFSFHQKLWSNNLHFVLDDTWLPASEEEVKDALIKEAERRGIVKGETIAKVGINADFNSRFESIQGFKWFSNSNILDTIGGNGHVFENGKWAEILSNPNEKILKRIATIEKELEQLKAELK